MANNFRILGELLDGSSINAHVFTGENDSVPGEVMLSMESRNGRSASEVHCFVNYLDMERLGEAFIKAAKEARQVAIYAQKYAEKVGG